MTQLRRKLDEYFFGESISTQGAVLYYGMYIAVTVICVTTLLAVK